MSDSSSLDFVVDNLNDDTVLVTSTKSLHGKSLDILVSEYDPENKKYSAYLNEGMAPSKILSAEEIDILATNTQNDLNKVLKINAYNRKLINKNDIIGKTVESINTNINSEVKLNYGDIVEGRNKKKKYDECDRFIKSFNKEIKLKQLIRNSITTSYVEGNWIAYLRHEDPNNYTVDIYPLGVCIITDTMINGEPIIWFDIKELRTRLQKVYRKTKNNKPLMFKNMDEEVKASYPPEVYKAYMNKENYAILDPKYTGVIRINNLNRKYGVSPILRAYMDLSMLDTFADSDRINAKAKSKKIIHQKMRKESMGTDYQKDFFPELSYAHTNFLAAWNQPTVVVTSPPTVEDIKYVEPTVEMTSKDTYNIYRSKVLATLGIQFLMDSGSQSVSTASISVTQLMRTINSISEQLEDVLYKWYRQVFYDNGLPLEYIPDIKVIDSEMLEMAIRKELATTLFSTMNASYETAYGILGVDINDELVKRQKENDNGYDDIFSPHGSQYTSSSNDTGRPAGTNTETEGKQEYDKTYNNTAR